MRPPAPYALPPRPVGIVNGRLVAHERFRDPLPVTRKLSANIVTSFVLYWLSPAHYNSEESWSLLSTWQLVSNPCFANRKVLLIIIQEHPYRRHTIERDIRRTPHAAALPMTSSNRRASRPSLRRREQPTHAGHTAAFVPNIATPCRELRPALRAAYQPDARAVITRYAQLPDLDKPRSPHSGTLSCS